MFDDGYRDLLDSIPEMVFELDDTGKIRYLNAVGARILGYDPAELSGMHIDEIVVSNDEMAGLGNFVLHEVCANGARSGEVILVHKDGQSVPYRVSISVNSHKGALPGFVCILVDISGVKTLEERLMKSEERLQRISNMALEGIVFNDSGRIIDANKAFAKMFGFELEDIIGMNLMDFAMPECHETIMDYFRKKETVPCEVRALKRNGEVFDVEFTSKSMMQDGKRIFAVVVQDISHRKRAEYIHEHDELTSLLNYRGFVKKLKHETNTAVSRGKKIAVMTIKIDEDRFNVIRDMQPEFEKILLNAIPLEISENLSAILFKGDTIARVGENEYMTIHPIPADHDIENSVKLIKKVLDIFSKEFIRGIKLVVHMGVTFYPDDCDNDNPVKIISNSRYACEEAIARKKDYMFYDENSHRETREQIEFVKDLIIAVKQEECANFVVHYQPKINTQREVVGTEALIRWVSPRWNIAEFGYVPPSRFIKVAEETGLIMDLGNWALKEACRQNREWQQMSDRLSGLQVAVNVSPSQLNDSFVEYVDDVLEETGIAPETLELEITERETIKDKNAKIIELLKKKNISIAIDDFGIDYSSLSKLPKLAIDTIKLDKSYIDNICSDIDYENLVYYTIKMVHGFNYTVVAEGVEDEVQADKLFFDMNCDKIQGFYFSKPLPPSELKKLLLKNRP